MGDLGPRSQKAVTQRVDRMGRFLSCIQGKWTGSRAYPVSATRRHREMLQDVMKNDPQGPPLHLRTEETPGHLFIILALFPRNEVADDDERGRAHHTLSPKLAPRTRKDQDG